MRLLPFLLALLGGVAGARAAEDGCVKCHAGLEGKAGEAVRLSAQDIHFQRGLACSACHGGDGTASEKAAAHDPAKGYRGPPRGKALLEACGRCHSDPAYMRDFNPTLRTDQVAQYLTSGHGKRLLEGDGKVATCVSCHGNHGILPVKDPAAPVYPTRVPETCGRCHSDASVMEGRRPSVDIPLKYRGSVHGRALLDRGDLGAPACNSCHGNHGAAPPEAGAVANVCGTCHAQQATLFRATTKKRLFDSGGSPECVTCHSEHDVRSPTDAMLSLAEGQVCNQCHSEPDDSARAGTESLARGFSTLSARLADAGEVLGRAERAGMEVSEAHVRLAEARNDLLEARVLVHSWDPPRVLEKIRAGEAIAVAQKEEGHRALQEIDFRRRGLYLSLGAIAVLAAGLWFAVREADRRYPPVEEESAGP